MKGILEHIRKPLPVVVLSGALALAGSVVAFEANPDTAKATGPTVNVPVDETPIPRASGPYAGFAPIVKKVTPAVVKVVTTVHPGSSETQESPGFNDPFWRHFFGGPMMPHGQMRAPLEHGLGSGVIVTKDGYILTNNHVVDGAQNVKVTLQDGREFTAKVIGRDPKSDIAVIKVSASNLPVVPFADSQKVQVGDIVLAIGNPFGVGQTVTQGIVSAMDRGGFMARDNYEDFIQTDAAINPGNSGGPLVDVDGRLIGINTAILSRSGGNQGIGFAIPSDLARTVMTSLIEYGHVTRGYLGVMIQNLSPQLAKEFKLKQSPGALVGDVVPNGPAAKAGLKEGDVVLQFNGKKMRDSRQLQLTVAETKPGATVPVQILRDGSPKTLEVTVGQLPGSQGLAQANPGNSQDTGALQGVGVTDLNHQARQEYKIPQNVQGAVVTEVRPDSAAAEAGLNPGDVIESINRHPVKNAEQAAQLTQNIKDKEILLRVWSNGGSHYVVVDESQTG